MELVYPSEKFFESFHKNLDSVAREEIYIEMIEAKPLEKLVEFQREMIEKNWPACFAVDNGEVVGWADITPSANPRLAHRGFLGMGLLKGYRGQGIGTKLLENCLEQAKRFGFEKVELSVYTENSAAIHLYKKIGFHEIGVVRHYRKLNGRYFDVLEMELFL